ncbi:hypothetical protein QJS04_geneDACA015331 [Acorus gramineus]|uniref:Uncharacterized protein n=1 Tax=Acorus gramineus TaxID=55184 RepID=A0AAV9APL1_ACOGR|nr:hypothetical protein QJS04_geneDACA015331 [Acorus gramineus]
MNQGGLCRREGAGECVAGEGFVANEGSEDCRRKGLCSFQYRMKGLCGEITGGEGGGSR